MTSPPNVAVPLPLSVKVIPAGSCPSSASVGVGVPVAVTVKSTGSRSSNCTKPALVMTGATVVVSARAAAGEATMSPAAVMNRMETTRSRLGMPLKTLM